MDPEGDDWEEERLQFLSSMAKVPLRMYIHLASHIHTAPTFATQTMVYAIALCAT